MQGEKNIFHRLCILFMKNQFGTGTQQHARGIADVLVNYNYLSGPIRILTRHLSSPLLAQISKLIDIDPYCSNLFLVE